MMRLIKLVVLTLCGCAIQVGCVHSKVLDSNQDSQVFDGYKSMYRYIAINDLKERGVVDVITPECIFKIATESNMEVNSIDGVPALYSIKVNYFQFDSKNQIMVNLARGSTGNGSFYFFVPVQNDIGAANNYGKYFRLVGVISGSSYKLETINHVPRIIAQWHMSAQDQVVTTYIWNGKTFASTP